MGIRSGGVVFEMVCVSMLAGKSSRMRSTRTGSRMMFEERDDSKLCTWYASFSSKVFSSFFHAKSTYGFDGVVSQRRKKSVLFVRLMFTVVLLAGCFVRDASRSWCLPIRIVRLSYQDQANNEGRKCKLYRMRTINNQHSKHRLPQLGCKQYPKVQGGCRRRRRRKYFFPWTSQSTLPL